MTLGFCLQRCQWEMKWQIGNTENLLVDELSKVSVGIRRRLLVVDNG